MEQILLDKSLKSASDEKKLFNIESFSSLDRSGLGYGVLERRLLMREFPTGEKLFIQYPGKETARDKYPRPWDFRPKMQLPNGEWLKDLSFKDVWDDLYSFRDMQANMSYIATLFFRIAYMIDTSKTTRTLPYEDIDSSGIAANRLQLMVSTLGFAPRTFRSSGGRSTPELRRHKEKAYFIR